MKLFIFLITIVLTFSPALVLAAVSGPYWGSKIMGNGHFCAVYSDHAQNEEGQYGLQHLYIGDYTKDFIAATRIWLNEKPVSFDSTWTDPYFAAKSMTHDAGILVFPMQHQNALIFQVNTAGKTIPEIAISFQFRAAAESRLIKVTPQDKDLQVVMADGQAFVLGFRKPGDLTLICAFGDNVKAANDTFSTLSEMGNLLSAAQKQWDQWLAQGHVPAFNEDEDTELYKTNLVAIKGVNLQGAIPADVTGQFVTNGLPQLYPRDAMMTARCFLETGHLAEAKEIVNFWNDIPYKTTGEWYARYDAYGQAVNAGSGAPYDVPEWDSNGYYASLIRRYYDLTGEWIGSEQRLWEVLDFIGTHRSENGLLEEGGIVEWVAFLPATNMSVCAGLLDGALVAQLKRDSVRAERYLQVSQEIAANLIQIYEQKRNAFFDWRQDQFFFNTSANFGYIWGFRLPEIVDWLVNTNEYYRQNCTKLEGGVQYFGSDGHAAGYGTDLFGFTTAAAAQFQAFEGTPDKFRDHLDWLKNNANTYGLIPERVHFPVSEEGTGVAEASPLSWCNAEFVMALLAGAEAGYLADPALAIDKMEQLAASLTQYNWQITKPKTWNQETITKIWTDCIDIMSRGDWLPMHVLSDLERISRNQIKQMIGLTVTTTLSENDVTGLPELTYGVSVQNAAEPARFGWRERPIFRPEKKFWGIRGDRVSQDDLPLLAKDEERVTEIIVDPLDQNLNFDWHQRVGLEFLYYVDENHALIYPAWIYLNGHAPLTVSAEESEPGRQAVITVTNNCPFPLDHFQIAMAGPFQTPNRPPKTIKGREKLEIPVRLPTETPLGSYPVNVTADSPAGRNFSAKDKIRVVKRIDLSGEWQFHVGDLTEDGPSGIIKPDFTPDGTWTLIPVPSEWEKEGHPDLDGVCWYRTTFQLNPAWGKSDLFLEFGAIDDNDVTYLNGQQVGHTEMWNAPRRYRITDIVRWDRANVISVKVTDLGFGGGVWKAPVGLVITDK